MELSSSSIKKVSFYTFLYFRKRKPPKKFFLFQETETFETEMELFFPKKL